MTGLTILIFFGLLMSFFAWRQRPLRVALRVTSIGCLGIGATALLGLSAPWVAGVYLSGVVLGDLRRGGIR